MDDRTKNRTTVQIISDEINLAETNFGQEFWLRLFGTSNRAPKDPLRFVQNCRKIFDPTT